MKLKYFTYEVFCAILDIYAEVCGGQYLVNSLKNETKYNDLISEFESRSSIERRFGSNICSFSKLWIRRDWDDTLTFSFDSKLTSVERRRLAVREKEMTEKFNARISEFLTTRDLFQKIEQVDRHQFSCKNYYMFGFNYNGGTPDEVIVEKPTSIDDNTILFHFDYGHKSLSEYVKKENIVAVGDKDGAFEVAGWKGRYSVLNKQEFLKLIQSGALEIKKCHGFVEVD